MWARTWRCFADLYEVPDLSGRIDQVLRVVNLVGWMWDACGTLSKGLRQLLPRCRPPHGLKSCTSRAAATAADGT